MRPLLRAVSPWGPEESVRVVALVAAGTAAMVAAWVVVAGRDEWGEQIGWANIAVAGAVVALYGVVSWLLRARAALLARRVALLPAPVAAVVPDDEGTRVADPAGGRLHRPSCPAAVARGWPALTDAGAGAADRRPCGICRP